MVTRVYEKGTIKVVWTESDPLRIFSKMFDGERAAQAFAEDKRDYVIFLLLQQKDMEEFSWKLLPYGKYKLYTILFRLYRGCIALFKR